MHFKREPIKDDSNGEEDFSAFTNLLLKIQYYLNTFFFSCRYSREQHKEKKAKDLIRRAETPGKS